MYLTVIHYCRQYPLWVQILKAETDALQGLSYDKDKVMTFGNSDTTAALGARRADISNKKEIIETTAKEVANGMHKWIILGCCYNMTYFQLKHNGIPCGKDTYYKLRRRFYYAVSEKI